MLTWFDMGFQGIHMVETFAVSTKGWKNQQSQEPKAKECLHRSRVTMQMQLFTKSLLILGSCLRQFKSRNSGEVLTRLVFEEAYQILFRPNTNTKYENDIQTTNTKPSQLCNQAKCLLWNFTLTI